MEQTQYTFEVTNHPDRKCCVVIDVSDHQFTLVRWSELCHKLYDILGYMTEFGAAEDGKVVVICKSEQDVFTLMMGL